METFIKPEAGWDERDIDIRLLDGEPPAGFDCGRDEQNEFLYERAYQDHERLISVTRLFFVKGILAAYVTTMTASVELGTREKDRGVRYPSLAALKIAQLAVDKRFSGCGLGTFLLGFVIAYARRRVSWTVGCRYVTLDAQPDLEGWYASHGFVRNRVMQKRKIEHARATGRDESTLTVSMRFDLIQCS